MRRGKRYKEVVDKVDKTAKYALPDAVKLLREINLARFDPSVDLHVRLNVDPRNSEHQVRGTVVLPNGTGKSVRVLVFAKGDKAKEATERMGRVSDMGRVTRSQACPYELYILRKLISIMGPRTSPSTKGGRG